MGAGFFNCIINKKKKIEIFKKGLVIQNIYRRTKCLQIREGNQLINVREPQMEWTIQRHRQHCMAHKTQDKDKQNTTKNTTKHRKIKRS